MTKSQSNSKPTTLAQIHAVELRRHRRLITSMTRAGESLLAIAGAICVKNGMIRFARLNDSTQTVYLSTFRVHHMGIKVVNPNFKTF